ncbi:hypothetical protein [Amycolatopsis panacis]|uniref:hypothetical protein n=1 Tax=Amycolatopsis panacis TaxID=2340917 RepID=UPI00131471A0|nr:hypothetical protein [Amycolatopsis panacis]
MRTRPAAALAVLAALVLGGVLGLFLVSGPGTAEHETPPPPATPHTGSPAPDADRVATTVVANALVQAMSASDTAEFATLTCRPQGKEALAGLQARWDAAGPMRASVASPPVVSGDEASVTVRVEASGGHKDTAFPLRRVHGRWCLAD